MESNVLPVSALLGLWKVAILTSCFNNANGPLISPDKCWQLV